MNLVIHRYIEIQGYMDTGIQGCRDIGIQLYRDTGIQGYRGTGIQQLNKKILYSCPQCFFYILSTKREGGIG